MIYNIWKWFLNLFIVHLCLPKYLRYLSISSNIVSFIHAISTILGTGYYIYNNQWTNDSFNESQTRLIYFSASYFIYDSIRMIFKKMDIMFLLHHILILFVYYITLSNDIGCKFIMYTIFYGEITNPLQISWHLSRVLKYNKINNYIFPLFSFNFTIIRLIILPYYHYNIFKDMYVNYYFTNYYSTIILILCSIIGNIGSLVWVKGIIKKLIK